MSYDADGNWIEDDIGVDPGGDMPSNDPSLNQWSSDPSQWTDAQWATFGNTGFDPGGNGQFTGNTDMFGNPVQTGAAGGAGGLLGGLGGLLQSGLGALTPLFGSLMNGPGGRGWGSVIPGTLALAYANRQPGIDTGGIRSVVDSLKGNQNAVIQAATDPVQRNFAAGYGDLLQSQAKRGIRGSSFGDTAIGDFMATGSRSVADAAANASQGSLALQGSLEGNIAQLQQQAQTMKNNLFGRAFDTLGRGLNPAGYGMYPATA